MKCSKCGEECNENQAFCMKCGNPIQVIPDLNLIEEELANSVGALMDETDDEDQEAEYDSRQKTKIVSKFGEDDYLTDTARYDEIHIPDIEDDSLEMIELARKHDARLYAKKQGTVSTEEFQVNGLEAEKSTPENREQKQHEKKLKRIKIGIFAGTAVVVIAIAALLLLLPGLKGKDKEEFADVYNQGIDYYTEEKYAKAIECFEKALNLTNDDKELIKTNEVIYNTYMKIGILELSETEIEDCIDILKTLIEMDRENKKYYENLMSLYAETERTEELAEWKKTLAGTEIGESLGISSVSSPVLSPEGGEYSRYITIELSAEEGTKIYYTTDGTAPDVNSTLYEEPVEYKEQGEFTIKAVAVNEKGDASEIASAEYAVKLESIDSPQVSPASGTYTQATKIEVTVPEGMKAYYTIDEYGKVPDTDSTEYTGPVDMPRGKNVFSVILVDESGMSSNVTENIYQYNLERQYTYDEALFALKEHLMEEDIIADESGAMMDGASMEFAYREISVIENNEYYLIEGTYKSSGGKVIDTYIYGVDTVTGDIVTITTVKDGKYKIK